MRMHDAMDVRGWPEWRWLAGFALAYFLLLALGYGFILKPLTYPACWPATGLLLGALLLVPTGRWWRWVLTAQPVCLLAEWLLGRTFQALPGSWLAGLVGGVAGAALIRWMVAARPQLLAVREMLGVVALGGGAGMALGGLLGAWVAWQAPASFAGAWVAQLAGNALGMLAVTPLVLVGDGALERFRRLTRPQLLEIALILGGVAGMVWLVFGWIPGAALSQAYFLLPVVVVAVLRLGLPGSALTNALLTALVLGATRLYLGPEGGNGPLAAGYVLNLQVFLGMTLFSTLLLGVVLKERQAAQAAVREQELRLRLVLEATSDGVWDANLRKQRSEYSRQWAEMLGYTLAEVENSLEFWRQLVHPADLPRVEETMARHLRGETPAYRCEYRMRRKDGGWQWLLSRGRAVSWDDQGRPTRLLGTHADISEQKTAEETLLRRDRILEAATAVGDVLLRSADPERALREGMARLGEVLDLGRVYVMANHRETDGRLTMHLRHEWGRPGAAPGALEDLCYDALEAPDQVGTLAARGVVCGRLEDFPPKFQDWLRRRGVGSLILAPVFVDRQWWGVLGFEEYRRARSWQTVEVEALKIVAELFGAMFQRQRDEQLLREREEESRRLDDRLQQMQRLDGLTAMAGGIAHDFNNLLMVMLGNADMLRRQVAGRPGELHMLDEIESSGQRAAELCRQMLAFSGHNQAQLQPVDLTRLARDTAGLLEVLVPSAAVFDCCPGAEACWVRGDPVQLRQVLINLVTNAVEALVAGRSGLVRIATGREWVGRAQLQETLLGGELAEGWYGFLGVEDNGCGMDAAVQERIFNPFFSTKFTGRGLGLPAVFGIIRGHGGMIRLHSAPERGSSFRLYFPEAAAGEMAGRNAAAAGREAALPVPKGVLVADDEPGLRQYLRHLFEAEGLVVIEAVDGRDAVERFARHPAAFAAAVLDAEMPVLDGMEAARQILALRPELPVVLVSGYFVDADRETPEAGSGAAGPIRLHKPFQREQLMAALGLKPAAG